MVKNMGEIALGCALARENKYTDLQIAKAGGIDEDQVGWMVGAGRDGTLRNVLESSDSIAAFCMFMEADSRVKMQVLRNAIESGGYLNQKLIETARRVVLIRVPRKSKVTNTDMRGDV